LGIYEYRRFLAYCSLSGKHDSFIKCLTIIKDNIAITGQIMKLAVYYNKARKSEFISKETIGYE
jgi:hypothetical protein